MGWLQYVGNGLQMHGDRVEAQAEQKLMKKAAKLAEYQAGEEIRRGIEDQGAIGREREQVTGAIRAGAAGRGLLVSEGVAADLEQSSAEQAALDQVRARYNAQQRARGLLIQSKLLKYQRKVSKHAMWSNLAGQALSIGGSSYGGGKTGGKT